MTENCKMEVLCACDERYLPHAATMLCSLLEHNSVSRVHFFYSAIDIHHLAKLRRLVSKYKSEVTFYEIVLADLPELPVDKWASPAVYYRLLAAQLLPTDLKKVLYLDSDIVVRCSLRDLWNTNLTDRALAAVSNYEDEARKALGLPDGTKYFNSGVLLINLQFWRENNVPERAISFIKNNPQKVQYWDQDALNAILIDQWIELPPYWNWQDWHESAVVHFIADDKPWQWSNTHPFKHEYHKYRLKTPWRRYKQEGQPSLPQRFDSSVRNFVRRFGSSVRNFARAVLPATLRQWIRSHFSNSQV
jgi:lipopolysaccharide biosynthesis glycosyltransferase